MGKKEISCRNTSGIKFNINEHKLHWVESIEGYTKDKLESIGINIIIYCEQILEWMIKQLFDFIKD